MDEFDLIDKFLKPLASGYSGALGLTDDAAIVNVPAGHELVITKDAISEGVHFLGSESPSFIARKLLRTNLSDLSAMGATPLCYFLAEMLPKGTKPEWLKEFADGLAIDQKVFSIHLAGGDTISTKGSRSFSITALGTVPAGKALRRSGAKVGDLIYVSGTLGDSALGLRSLKQNPKAEGFLEQRYLLPQPRIALGQKLLGLASAAMDISDGLLQDANHLFRASGVGGSIERNRLPLSDEAARLIKGDALLWDAVVAGGDDYELLFTTSPEKEKQIKLLSDELKLKLSLIGKVTEGNSLKLLDEKGKELSITHKGFSHF